MELGQLEDVLAKWLPVSVYGDSTDMAVRGAGDTLRCFNSESLLRRLDGDRQLAGAVIESFLHHTPSRLDSLCLQFRNGDAKGTRNQAHALKGAAATVSADSLHALAQAVERAGDTGQMQQCGELLLRAVEEFERFKRTVQQSGWT